MDGSLFRIGPDHAREEPLSYILWKGEWKLIDSEVTRVILHTYEWNWRNFERRNKNPSDNIVSRN